MKKIISLFLSLTFVLTLCSCGNKTAGKKSIAASVGKGDFRAGFARVEIVPDESVPLAGLGNTERRMSTGYIDPIYINAVAFADENGDVLATLVCDNVKIQKVISDVALKKISEETGLPEDHIFISATHTHSAPDTGNTKISSVIRYNSAFINWMVDAVKQSIADLKSAKIYMGTTTITGYNFVRHYLCKDGTYAGDNFGDYSSGIVRHETEADHEMRLVRLERKDGKDILMTNFQVHPTMNCGDTEYDVSADLVGIFRDNMEEMNDVHCIYYQGASGNINPRSEIASETPTRDYRQYGKELAEKASTALKSLKEAKSGNIVVSKKTVTADINHTEDSLVQAATVVNVVWTSTNDSSQAKAEAKKFGLHSQYHATGILERVNLPKTEKFDISAAKIGDLSFIGAPYEMFDVNGMEIREKSPYKMTFIIGYFAGHRGYIPADYSYDNTCYEADTTRYAKGTAEQVAKEFISMLGSLKG